MTAPVLQAQCGRIGENGQFGLFVRPGDLAALVSGAGEAIAGGGQFGQQGPSAPVECRPEGLRTGWVGGSNQREYLAADRPGRWN